MLILPLLSPLFMFRTEIGHGSNVQAIETRAAYDEKTQEFVLTSPTPTSTKLMIGNVGVYGEIVVLMAQLYISGECKGVHAFIVPLRESCGGAPLPGVDIGDAGYKTSWNEVDNAWIRFRGMRIPRDALLDKLAQVTSEGKYVSSISSPGKRFAATMAQLLVGRINYVAAPIFCVQVGLNTAIRYALTRRQFVTDTVKKSKVAKGEKTVKEERALENLIMNYTTHTTMLMNCLAKSILLQFARNDTIARLPLAKAHPDTVLPEYHAFLSGLKAYVCEWAYIQLGHLRVMTGGAGILAVNGIGALHNWIDVFQTAEGDRVVLYQQLGKYLVAEAAESFKGANGLLFNFAAPVLSQKLIQLNPLLSAVEDNAPSSLQSPGFILKALELRHKTTIRDLTSKLQSLVTAAKPLSPGQAWNECLLDIIKCCDAYLEYRVFMLVYKHILSLSAKIDALRQLPKASASKLTPEQGSAEIKTLEAVRKVLRRVAAVGGLGFLRDDAAFFLQSGLFSARRTDLIESTWRECCKNLREKDVEVLLSSSEVAASTAPLAHPDGDYPSLLLRAMKPSQAKL